MYAQLPSSSIYALHEPALPEDVAQALYLISSILSLNDEPGIQPGQLTGMSHVLGNAKRAWSDLSANCPGC